jgi:nitronate monooxygenase
VQLLARRLSVPIVAAGGFCDGAGLAAAMLVGAEGIAMGSRFVLAAESPIHERVRELLLAATDADTIVTDQIDGLPSRVLRTDLALALAASSGYQIGDVSPGADTFSALRLGDIERGVVAIGQVVGALSDVPTCAEIVDRVVTQAEALIARRAQENVNPPT